MKSNSFKFIAAITGLTLVLVLMEFFSTYNNTFNLARLGIIIALLVLVALTINPIVELTDAATSPKDGSNYSIAALTITFAGIASLINLLEVLRKSNLTYDINF